MAALTEVLTLLNGAMCGATCLRLLSYRRQGARYKRWASLLAYLMIVASGSVAIRIALGQYRAIDFSECLLNIVLCLAVFSARGNVCDLLRAPPRAGAPHHPQ
ncbi:phage holin family protein [Chromobacterium sp.]|uniref:phage holin family protein n=1 Tax=Chromobacterium sp. TaxID=306190 RepID=UPI0035B4EEBF